MAYVPNSGSVVAFQSDATKLQAGVSVLGLTPVSVSNFPGNQSVSGTVQVDIRSSVATVIIGGSVAVGTQYLENNIVPSVTGTAVMFKSNISSSIMSVVTPQTPLPVSVQGVVTALQGTTPWLTNQGGSVISVFQSSSVVAVVTGSVVSIPVGSVITVNQSSSVIAVVTGSVALASSVISVPIGSVITVFQSSSLIAVNAGSVITVPSGSVITIQQANSIVGTYAEDAASASADKGVFVLGVRNDTVSSVTSANGDYGAISVDAIGRTIIKPFAGEDATIISYTGSVVSGSVTLIQASAVGLRSYITDFLISNTGTAATLITFQGGDTSIVGYTIAPAGGGSNAIGMAIPLKNNVSQDLAFKSGTSTSILYLTIKGYQAQ